MENERLDLSQIDWIRVLTRLGVDAKYLRKSQGPCPIEQAGNTRFRFDNKEGNGTWYCNRCGAGNGLTLVAKVNGWSLEDAVRAIADEAKIVAIRPYVITKCKNPTRDELRSKLQKVWDEAVPVIQGDPVWHYLHRRVPDLTTLPEPSNLRHHPALEFWEEIRGAGSRIRYKSRGKHPALLAKIRDKDGRPVNLQRIYLTSEGQKAEIRSSTCPNEFLGVKKQMTGTTKFTGGGIHLYGPDGSGRLGVGEGLETLLSVRAASRNRLVVWACLSEGGLGKFVIPGWVTELHIFSDNDLPDEKGRRPGQASAIALYRRAIKEGFLDRTRKMGHKKVFLHLPKIQGTDFNDQWLAVIGQAA